MTNKTIWVGLIGIFSVLFLQACDPVYKTKYSYVPPGGGDARACVYQCENTRLHCMQSQELQYTQCEHNKEQERLRYDLCIERNKNRKKDDKENCFSYQTSYGACRVNEKVCVEPYNRCYQGCGGKVTGKEVCVSNCDKVK